MEESKMSAKGIIIEKLTVGWLQIIIAAFTFGGAVYTIGSIYDLSVKTRAVQEAALEKYVPIIVRLDRESSTTTESMNKLTATLDRFNDNMTVILTLRKRDDQDKKKLEEKVTSLNREVTELKIEIKSLKK